MEPRRGAILGGGMNDPSGHLFRRPCWNMMHLGPLSDRMIAMTEITTSVAFEGICVPKDRVKEPGHAMRRN